MYFNLQKFREEKGLSQLELAKKSSVSQAFISQIESGKKVPTVFIAKKIALALDIPVDGLIELREKA